MLKIKDNIDLKELKKFGFKLDESKQFYYKQCTGTFNKIFIMNSKKIDYLKRQIIFLNESNFQTTLYLETLYDLIEAGFVEKIKED